MCVCVIELGGEKKEKKKTQVTYLWFPRWFCALRPYGFFQKNNWDETDPMAVKEGILPLITMFVCTVLSRIIKGFD